MLHLLPQWLLLSRSSFSLMAKYTFHKIHHVQFCVFSSFTLLCYRHLHPSPEFFHLPKLKLYSLENIPHFLATIILSVSKNLTPLGTSHLWTHIIVLSGLAYFTQHSIFKAHPSCGTRQNFLPFKGRIILHCIYIYHPLLIHSPINDTFTFWLL